MHAYNTLDPKQENDMWKRRMYENIYGDMIELLGFNKDKGDFTPRSLPDEWDHRGGYDLIFPPEDGNMAPFDYYDQHLTDEDRALYAQLVSHIAATKKA